LLRNLPLSRRLLAATGAAALGLLGVFTFAGPASAHSTGPTNSVKCGPDANTQIIHWTVTNDFRTPATLSDVKLSGATTTGGIGDIVDGRSLVRSGQEGSSRSADQTVTGKGTMTLSYTATWEDGFARSEHSTVHYDATNCKTEGGSEAKPEFTSNCDGSVKVTLHNPLRKEITYTISAGGKDIKVAVPKNSDKTVDVAAAGGKVVVKLGPWKTEYTWAKPGNCGVPTLTSTSDCNELKITVANPADGEPVKVVVTVGTTEKLNVTLKPGEKNEVRLGRVDGLVAKVTIGEKSQDVKYAQPANCGEALPVTGANTAAVAGGAAVLLAAGGGLFLVARRRRVRFTA